jgi:hypothetical protein
MRDQNIQRKKCDDILRYGKLSYMPPNKVWVEMVFGFFNFKRTHILGLSTKSKNHPTLFWVKMMFFTSVNFVMMI